MNPVKSSINVKKRNGRLEPLDLDKINRSVMRACEGISDVSASEVVLDASIQLHDKVSTIDIDKALVLSAKSKIVREPNYAYVAARLTLNMLYKEAFGEGVDCDGFELQYKKAFITNLRKLVKANRVDSRLLEKFDLKKLAEAIKPSRDEKFKYLGIQLIYDRYLIHISGRRMETPQAFYMRVAMGLSLNETDPTQKAIEFYDQLSNFYSMSSTPTLFNSGSIRPQLSSCYLSTVDDSLSGIYGSIGNMALLSKFAGGLGCDWASLRSRNSYIQGTNGTTDGYLPWLRQYNVMLGSVNQGGKRKGAGAAYSSDHHGDLFDFIDLRKNTGDERIRCHELNTAIWYSDLFMLRAMNNQNWYLFDPAETRILNESFGEEFERNYLEFEAMAERGELKNAKKVSAKDLWKKCLTSLKETGFPWVTWKDPSNIRYSNQHEGIVRGSNLCTEILLHTKPTIYNDYLQVEKFGETAVCNLASMNLPELFRAAGRNMNRFYDLLKEKVKLTVRMLDNVIDINLYPTIESKNSNLRHRPIGLGIMGFHDFLLEQGVAYDSPEAIEIADKIQERISLYAIQESSNLAKERGRYESYEGSLWSKDIFPIDTFNQLMKIRAKQLGHEFVPTKVSPELEEEWNECRSSVKIHGMRNSNVMAIAPTATIADHVGSSNGIDPYMTNMTAKSTLSGEFTVVNEYMCKDLKAAGVWTPANIALLAQNDGDISVLDVSDSMKNLYKTAYDIEQSTLIRCAARRQKWIDMGQSLNLYSKSNSLKALNDMYMLAWTLGLKTTYYLHNKIDNKIEKMAVSTVASEEPKVESACSLEARRRGEVCESCQ